MTQSMADFETAVEKLIEIEGGFSPRDNAAGAVSMGITSAFLKLIGRPHSAEDVKALTKADAKEIYREYFWRKFRLGGLLSQRMADALLICLVNMNPQEVIYALHEALAAAGRPVVFHPIGKRDRVLGLITIGALNCLGEVQQGALLEDFKRRMVKYYESLAEEKPEKFGDDLGGWLNRVEKL